MQQNALRFSDLRTLIRIFAIAVRQTQPARASLQARARVAKLTIKEAAQKLKKDVSTLYRWRFIPGKLKPSYDAGGQPFYDANDIEDYLTNQTTRP